RNSAPAVAVWRKRQATAKQPHQSQEAQLHQVDTGDSRHAPAKIHLSFRFFKNYFFVEDFVQDETASRIVRLGHRGSRNIVQKIW
ncbi:hypothetical protein AVEN_92349-1, partial [Araneus ventricosus]